MTLPSFLSKQISKAQKPNNEGKSSWQNSWKFSTGKIIKWWYQSGLVRNVHGICSHQNQMSCDFIILNMLYAFCAIFLKFFIYLSFWLCWVLIAVHGLFSSCREWGLLSSCSDDFSLQHLLLSHSLLADTQTSVVASRSSVVVVRGF